MSHLCEFSGSEQSSQMEIQNVNEERELIIKYIEIWLVCLCSSIDYIVFRRATIKELWNDLVPQTGIQFETLNNHSRKVKKKKITSEWHESLATILIISNAYHLRFIFPGKKLKNLLKSVRKRNLPITKLASPLEKEWAPL